MIEKMIDSIDFETLFAGYVKLSKLNLSEQYNERLKIVLKEKLENDKTNKLALYNTMKQNKLI